MGYNFWPLFMPNHFGIDVKHFVLYLVGYWIVLYSYKCLALVSRIQLFGKCAILLGLVCKLWRAAPEPHLISKTLLSALTHVP